MLWLLFAFWTANLFRQKGRSAWSGFWLGSFTGPIGVLVALMISTQGNLSQGICPACLERIQPNAKKCKHCKEKFPS